MPKSSQFTRRDLLAMSGLGSIAAVGLSPSIAAGQSASEPVEEVPSPGPSQEKTGVLYAAKEGPWGNLSYYYFYLEAPAYLIENYPMRNPRTRWAVPLEQEMAFRSVLESLPMTDGQRRSLFSPDNVGVGDGLYVIFPPAEVLETLSSEARSILYAYLGRFAENPDIQNPVRIRSGSVDEWASGTTMRPEIVAKMKAMTYYRGDLMLFADFPHLLSLAESEAEARTLQKHSSRVRSMLVRLDVKEGINVSEIMPYWTTGLGLRRKEVEQMVQAAIDTPGVTGFDLVHMLPPLPRKLLYTYADSSMAVDGILPDCHWTTLNFFNYNPEPIYLDEFFAASRLVAAFEPVEPPYRYGDALVFLTEEMNAYHSCIYIAADLVYTKNGRSLYAPWTMLYLKDVQSTYPDFEGKPLRIQGYRRKKNESA